MTLKGETIATGASKKCKTCSVVMEDKVLRSSAGYYIGTECDCGRYSRESMYYHYEEDANKALSENNYSRW